MSILSESAPILEFDGEPEAILEPRKLITPLATMPTHGVICFFQDVITHFSNLGLVQEIYAMGSEMGRHPIYVHEVQGQRVALFHPGVGAPLAAGLLEEVIALGCNTLVACGGAGVLNRELALGHLVVPNAAVRDEGTSYHYLPPGREVAPSPAAVAAIEQTLQRRKVEYILGKTWTTDAIYRETRARMALRRSEGCVTVEMEAAALFAVAQFRGIHLGQILYCGDNLDGDEWDGREWQKNWGIREVLVELAAEACLAITPS
jgi:uridine phosphorylase